MEEGPETSREHLGQVQTATKIGNKTSEGNSALDVAIEKARASIARRTRRVNLPGKEYKPRPIRINGIDYDPFSPPKLFINPDGSTEYRGGRKLNSETTRELIDSSVIMNEKARQAWGLFVTQFLELQNVRIENLDEDFERQNPRTGAKYIHPKTPAEQPKILLPRDWKRAISYPKSSEGRPILEFIADKLEIAPDAITDDMLATFVLIHEGGHVIDHKGKTMEEHDQEKEAELKSLPARNLSHFMRKFPDATHEDLSNFIRQYRNIPTEARADK